MNKDNCFYDRIDGDWLDSQSDWNDTPIHDLQDGHIKMLEMFLDEDYGLRNWITEKEKKKVKNFLDQEYYLTDDKDFLNGLKSEYLQFMERIGK